MQVKRNFDVIKRMWVNQSMNNDDELIFKDSRGKTYFIDKKDTTGYDKLELGQVVLVWIVKEFVNIGYIRLDIDGLSVLEFIKNIPDLDQVYYERLDKEFANRDVMLANYMHNHDLTYNDYLLIDTDNKLLETAKDIIDSNSSKLDDFKISIIRLHSYL